MGGEQGWVGQKGVWSERDDIFLAYIGLLLMACELHRQCVSQLSRVQVWCCLADSRGAAHH